MRGQGNYIIDRRLKFKKGFQRKFLRKVKEKAGLTWRELAIKLSLSSHTLRIDWQQEKTTMPYQIGESLAREYFPKEWSRVLSSWVEEILPAKWGQLKAGGKNKKTMKVPVKNEYIAEFLGVILGDGHLERKTLTITGNSNERTHYLYLKKKIEEFFGFNSIITKIKNQNTMRLRVYSTELIDYLKNNGFVLGNKIENHARLPEWIFEKEEFMAGALRGLFDTDGGIYFKQKRYRRAFIEFQTHSKDIRENIISMLKKCGFSPSKGATHSGYLNARQGENIRIQNQDEVLRFFQIVGSSNPKNIVRYNHFIKEGFIPLKEKLNKEVISLKVDKPFKAALI